MADSTRLLDRRLYGKQRRCFCERGEAEKLEKCMFVGTNEENNY